MQSASWREAVWRGEIITVVMAEIDHPEGMVRAWNGIGVLDYGGEEYSGVFPLGSVEPVSADTEIAVTEVTFVLSGVDPGLIEGLDEDVRGRSALLYEAALDRNYRVLERELVVDGVGDYQRFTVDPDRGEASIRFVANAGFHELTRRSAATVSTETQRRRDADDTGFDEVFKQPDIAPVWRAA